MATERVDVLALFDAYIAHGIPQERPELQRARAAVAELVEAHRNALRALDALFENWPKDAPAPKGWDDCCAAYDAGHAALARIGGDEG